jgi:hypothetical protein
MAEAIPIFMRPVVIDSTNKDFSYDDGGGVTACALTTGTYPCLPAVLKEFTTQSGITTAITAGYVVLSHGIVVFSVTWTDTALRDLLGFTANLSGATSYTATYTPENCWVPTRSRADNDNFQIDHKLQWKGSESRTGNVGGLRSSAEVYRTSIEIEALDGALVSQALAESAIDKERSLDYFASQSREVWGTAGEPSPSGFYYWPDRTNVTTASASSVYDSGDAATLFYSSSPDVFLFCHFDSNWYPRSKPFIGSCRADYYNVTLDIHTATAPTWTGA